MKTVFLPITSSRDGWTLRRERLLARLTNTRDVRSTIQCVCGASHQTSLVDTTLPKWVDQHGQHMPALPDEPPEYGNAIEYDDADPDAVRGLSDPNRSYSMRRARRWPDGRIEIVEQSIDDAPPSPSSGALPPDLESAAKALIREAMRAAYAIDSIQTVDRECLAEVAKSLRDEADGLRRAMGLGEEET